MSVNYLRLGTAKKAGAYVKECRVAASYTQKNLDEKCGFSSGFIGKLERGEVKRISIPDMWKLEYALKKFKRSAFELEGKTELELSEIVGTPKSPKTKVLLSGNADVAEPSVLSMWLEGLWRLAVSIVIIYMIGNWLFSSGQSDTQQPAWVPDTSKDSPIGNVINPPSYVPDTTQQSNCGYNDSNCDGVDDSQPRQPAWNPGYDYDGDGIPNMGDTDVNGDGSPNGWDVFSDPYEIGGLSNWGCPIGQQSC